MIRRLRPAVALAAASLVLPLAASPAAAAPAAPAPAAAATALAASSKQCGPAVMWNHVPSTGPVVLNDNFSSGSVVFDSSDGAQISGRVKGSPLAKYSKSFTQVKFTAYDRQGRKLTTQTRTVRAKQEKSFNFHIPGTWAKPVSQVFIYTYTSDPTHGRVFTAQSWAMRGPRC